jgi:hypothetical protein
MDQANFDHVVTKEIVKKHAKELYQELLESNSISLLTICVKEGGELSVITHKYLSPKDLDGCSDIIVKNRAGILKKR